MFKDFAEGVVIAFLVVATVGMTVLVVSMAIFAVLELRERLKGGEK